MAALDFPTSPVLNDVYTANGKSWRWNGTSWVSTNTGYTGSQGTTGYTGSIPQTSVQSTTSASSITPTSTNDLVSVSALAVTLTVNNQTGTPDDGKKLLIRIKDDGTTKTINWDTNYVAGGATMPTSTTAGKWHHVGFVYNMNTNTWLCVAAAVQA